ncbi:MAG: DUF1858 domain-containing protein [Oscillospiraceae bacterium]
MFEVTKETLIADIMEQAPQSIVMFQAIGMHCMGCAMASGETVAEACEVHGVNVDEFITSLNAFIEQLA